MDDYFVGDLRHDKMTYQCRYRPGNVHTDGAFIVLPYQKTRSQAPWTKPSVVTESIRSQTNDFKMNTSHFLARRLALLW